eukprot:6395428-Pyramimonas_sp.AAC.1
MQARVEACRKLFRTRCRAAAVSAGNVDRRGRAPGRHRHRPVSRLVITGIDSERSGASACRIQLRTLSAA